MNIFKNHKVSTFSTNFKPIAYEMTICKESLNSTVSNLLYLLFVLLDTKFYISFTFPSLSEICCLLLNIRFIFYELLLLLLLF